ncbi:MAG: adenylate/guanylate cyclase domain-containing protein [Elusimicrobia bacterium]|nr:adenylate/guanylate cyclase domain-containing protein [Elusimicrobiota bacterium]
MYSGNTTKIQRFFPGYTAPLIVLVLALVLRVSGFGWIEDFQCKVFDYYQRLKPRPYQETPVRVIDLDDESLERLGQWPWPRTLVARLVTKLSDLGVSTIVFDMVFAEPDRTSPGTVVRFWPAGPDTDSLKARAKSLPDHEKVLAKAFRRANVVTGFTVVPTPNDKVPAVKAAFGYGGDSPLSYVPDYPGAVVNLPVLEEAASGNGCFSFMAERDGVVRRAPLLMRRGSVLVPSLALEALRAAQGVKNVMVKSVGASDEDDTGGHTGIVAVKVGQFVIPTDAWGRIWVHFSRRNPKRTIPAWKVLEGGIPQGDLEGAIVFVGTSALGLMDLRVTPTEPVTPGVEIHANIVEQVLVDDNLKRPDWASGAEVVFLLAMGLALIFLLPRLGAALCLGLSLASIGGAVAFSWHSYSDLHFMLDPVFPSLTVLAVYTVASLMGYLKTEGEKKHIRGAFGQYLPPVLVEQLAAHPEKLQLGGELRNITIHFCDIRGFTTISEACDPIGLTRLINGFLTPMTEIIMKHKGCIDKYIGDCIMAFWNAPLDDPGHAANACRAALEMHARLAELNKAWEAEALAAGRKHLAIKIGTGLNTGDAVVGNLGSEQRFGYSVLGDDVNLASRLEGQSKYYGVKIVVGGSTREMAQDFAFLELDLIRVKGKLQPVRIFTLLGDAGVKESPVFQELQLAHDAMLASYRGQKWGQAVELLGRCRKLEPSLKVLHDLYAERIQAFRENPPESDWDGVYVATSK